MHSITPIPMKFFLSSVVTSVCHSIAALTAGGSEQENLPRLRPRRISRLLGSLPALLVLSSVGVMPSIRAAWTTPPPSTATTGQSISVAFLYSPSSWTTASVWVLAPGSSTWSQCGGGGGTIGGTISGSGGYGFSAAGTYVMKAVGGTVASGTVIAGPSSISVSTGSHAPTFSLSRPSSLTTNQSFTISMNGYDQDGDLHSMGVRWQGMGLVGGPWVEPEISGSSASKTTGTLTAPSSPGSINIRGEIWDKANHGVTGEWISIPVIAPPTITTHPQSQSVTVGGTASFSVSVSGSSPFSYQWKKNGSNVSGATSSIYSISNAQTSHAGSYSVVVTNSAGSATSNAATLTVNAAVQPPAITTQPQSQTVTVGGTASFSVSASGSSPFSYQWKKSGSNISGATSSSYSISNAQTSHAGSYTVTVTNSAGSVASNAATLTVTAAVQPPTITTQPQSQTVTAGEAASFAVSVTGTAPFSYQWRKNGANIAGATAATLVLTNVQSSQAGTYTVLVANSAGSVTSAGATLTVSAAGDPVALNVHLPLSP
jgi:hypothetical protein